MLSLARVPLALGFVLLIERPLAAVVVLLAAGFSDVLDGWVARRQGLVTATGMVLDPITDKLFVLTVAIALVLRGYLSIGAVLLLSTREHGEAPLLAWFALSHRAQVAEPPSANRLGKLATVLQFATVCFALFHSPYQNGLLALTALMGCLAAASYWARSLRAAR